MSQRAPTFPRARVCAAPRVDWRAMLLALRREGYTVRHIAMATSIPRTTLYAWEGGSVPTHQDGETLIRLWETVTQLPREALPVAQPTDGARLYRQR